MPTPMEKTKALLRFLRDASISRRKRIATYSAEDRLLWLADVPKDLPQNWIDACESAFLSDNPTEIPDSWLEVRKKRKPTFPTLPKELVDWVPQKFQGRPEAYLNTTTDELLDILNRDITVLAERRTPDPDAPPGELRALTETVPESRQLQDYPQVQDAWLDYLMNRWEPWAEETRYWQQVQEVYERVDFMRRRLEEAEERYELVLAVGLLQWRDSTGTIVERHLLTAPAEITLDAARGVLTVGPAASFERFRIELDMLDLKDRPRLEDDTTLQDLLESLDVRAWDRDAVAKILRVIANKASPHAQLSEGAWKPSEHADDTFRVLYAPALVLRERRPASYERLVTRLLDEAEDPSSFSATVPWERFVGEGETSARPDTGAPHADDAPNDGDGRLYFPLPTNGEQRQIAERLRARPYVLVKGPPGTGKSHTIANLICHLLARGERVLVTAQAPKALTVLLTLLPDRIRTLCVTALGSSREDHRLLEDSVRAILSQRSSWKGEGWAQGEIDRLEGELRRLEEEAARVDRQLRELREAEGYPHTLPGGYSGTAAHIARQTEMEWQAYGWFPELPDDETRCPLQPEDAHFLADIYGNLTQQRLDELGRDIGTFDLPNPSDFDEAIRRLNAAESVARAALDMVTGEQLRALEGFSDANLGACRTLLTQLEELATGAGRILGGLTPEILKDLLVGQPARWERLRRETAELVEGILAARKRVGTANIDIQPDVDSRKLLSDAKRRLEHFRKGGWRGWGVLSPRAVRETRYVEASCRVNGAAPRDQGLLDTVVEFLALKESLERFYAIWPTTSAPPSQDPRHATDDACDLVQQLCWLLDFFGSCDREALAVIPIEQRAALAESSERARWRRVIESELALRLVRETRASLGAWEQAIHSLDPRSAHPCMEQLARAIDDRDPARWSAAWATREELRAEKERLHRYQELLDRIRLACPELARAVEVTQGDPIWRDRLRQLGRAWDWATARAWLRKATNPENYKRLTQKRHQLQEALESKTEELAVLRSWHAFLQRLDDQTEQSLVAWTRAVARIGRGTGKYAYRHRRTAQRYLTSCIPKMPAWIMPLYKLWETVDPTPGIFDTAIVDEASQAGTEALALFLLTKRVIVVGDDKQNSPEAVGVPEDDIARLARDHLGQFRFRDEFRPDTSLYDHAERAFGTAISLREHFRCVPEIIRFSNDLCYTDAPLIPLRQRPPSGLSPLKAQFVEGGFCEGEGQRLSNRPEADAIVNTIQQCLEDPRYEGKTMGVIALQGRVQAELIERKLSEALEPEVREERKLRCGVPATFQGDQRDVIFLSLVVAPNHHSRSLTELEAQRRFNVAMSRARDQVWLFHSVKREDLHHDDLRRRLLDFFDSSGRGALETLYEQLDRLEREARRRPRERGEQPDPYGSWFEVDFALELLRRRYRLRPQVEVAGYRIDLVIEGLENRLAVECDGEVWHAPERFEQDTARQRQLERAGWKFVRIRESEFYVDRVRAVRRVIAACEDLGIQPVGEEEPEVEEPTVASSPEDDENADVAEEHRAPSPLLPAEDLSFPDPRSAPPVAVRGALRHIVEREGPVTKRFLIRLYVEGCPAVQRAGKSVRSRLNRVLYDMQRAGDIVIVDELGDRSLDSQVVRLAGTPRVRERPAGQRGLLEIPASELMLVLDRLHVSPAGTMNDDGTLARLLLEHYGFKQLTANRREYLRKVISHWRRAENARSSS